MRRYDVTIRLAVEYVGGVVTDELSDRTLRHLTTGLIDAVTREAAHVALRAVETVTVLAVTAREAKDDGPTGG